VTWNEINGSYLTANMEEEEEEEEEEEDSGLF
jgi:hypothetical protein